MWEYIVLGQVPGTSVQISFESWVWITVTLSAAYLLYKAYRAAARGHTVAMVRIGLVMRGAAYAERLSIRAAYYQATV